MDYNAIINLVTGFVLFVVAIKYDIHMFQLNSYRYSRYFRWLFPANIHTHNKWLILVASLCLLFQLAFTYTNDNSLCFYFPFILLPAIAYIVYEIKTGKSYKTPLVFTDRIKRLYTTSLLLYIVGITVSVIFMPNHVTVVAALGLLFSNVVMLIANIVNTPLEKSINRYYYNDAKKIIRSNKNLIVIGITGSFGKTSTKNYLANLLAEKYNVLVTPGNFNTLLGVVRTIREQLRPYHQVFIVEMGAKQQGDIQEICDLVQPSIGIITAVGEMHLETFKCVENIQKTKFELINSLKESGLGIINIDSQLAFEFKGITSNCKLLTYAIERNAMLKAENVEYNANGISFTADGDEFASRLLGAGNLLNMLAAIAVAKHLSVPVAKQKSAIARLQPVEHRMSMRRANGITVLDDAYNSNPQGAKMALDVLRNFAVGENNKRIVITPGFVEMGSRQYEANKELGEYIAKSCDYAIVVNATNRDAIKSGLEIQNFANDKLFLADSLNHAHMHLATILKAGDVVLYENDLPDNFK